MPSFPAPQHSMSLSNQPGALGAIARFWQRTYAADYVALGIVATGFVLIQIFITPFHRMFYLDNMAIQFPFAKVERVPILWSIVYSAVLPATFIFAWGLITRPSAHKFHVTLLGLGVSLMVTPFITDIIKNAVGRPRPDLIDRCQPEQGTAAHRLVTFSICTQSNEHILQEGWRSFPSGHSSFAFAGLGFLSLFISGQLHVFRPRADLGRCLFAFLPTVGAALIAISRCEDYRHDVWDVSVGGILGSCIAYFTYRRYYPSLRDRQCHVPYDRTDSALYTMDGFSKFADDEERLLGVGLGQRQRGTRESSQRRLGEEEPQNQRGWESPEGSIHMDNVTSSRG
ncbi:PAP2 domain protein [Talaromyces proteolyticus]|uniref:PAP2 domain protein n=1 Tax=Talaromyces proteolyticus TaxID=1131652 RepID=A0AAD4L029_9EURO|nr:PAP2 domain protein [Talaromyces proteolyticus]KAH8701621.1 PAP2 domain protein [Talaromyces proteolyticus]